MVFTKSFQLQVLLLAVGALTGMAVEAAIPKAVYKNHGIFTGGLGGYGFSLLEIRRTASSSKNLERFVIDIGDLAGHTQGGLPGYYHAEVQTNPHRLILSLRQTTLTNFSNTELHKQLQNSLFVRSAQISLNKEDLTTNVIFNLKPQVKIKVFPIEGKKKTAKIVIDITKTIPKSKRI